MTNPFDEPCHNRNVSFSGTSATAAGWGSNRVEILEFPAERIQGQSPQNSNSFSPGYETKFFASFKLTEDIVAFTIPVLRMTTSNNVEALMIRTLEHNGTKVSTPETVTWFLTPGF